MERLPSSAVVGVGDRQDTKMRPGRADQTPPKATDPGRNLRSPPWDLTGMSSTQDGDRPLVGSEESGYHSIWLSMREVSFSQGQRKSTPFPSPSGVFGMYSWTRTCEIQRDWMCGMSAVLPFYHSSVIDPCDFVGRLSTCVVMEVCR